MSSKRINPDCQNDEALPGLVLMSRVVVALMGVLLLLMPWSEQYSGFDDFPHGQDTEVGLLGFFIILGLVLLFARSLSRALGALMVVFFVFLSVARGRGSRLREFMEQVVHAGLAGPPGLAVAPGAFNLPLQI